MARRSTIKLTPESAATSLAIPVLYLLAERAQAIFPQTRASSPSSKVIVQQRGEIWEADASYFPVVVSWLQWENAVVPVLTDPDLLIRAPLIKRAIQEGRLGSLVDLVGKKLEASFRKAGYGPPA